MPIEVTKVVPYRHVFVQDPDGASWVEILPVTERMEQQRGALLSVNEVGTDERGYTTQRVIANPREVEREELYLTFGGGHIELLIAPEGDEGEPESVVLFDREGITRAQFFADYDTLSRHAPGVRQSWVNAVRGRRMGWYFPF